MMKSVELPELKQIMFHIVKGLIDKINLHNLNPNKAKYPDSPVLRHGLNELVLYAMVKNCCDEEGNLLVPTDETDAFLNYLSKPVAEWMRKWPKESILAAKENHLFDWDALIEIGDKNTFILTEFCEQLTDVHRMHLVETELTQENFYKRLIKLRQIEYETIRRFVIEKDNRVIKAEKLNRVILDLGVQFGKSDEIKQVFSTAYETWDNYESKIYICSRCGWTVEFDKNGNGSCQNDRCRNATNNFQEVDTIYDSAANYYRLKKGIMRFVADPGSIELEIESECSKIDVKTEMWPEMDKYDIIIRFIDGECWAVDAKDYSRAFLLKDKIQKDEAAIPHGKWDKGFIVVPEERLKDDRAYCQVVNSGIKNVGQSSKVRCLGYKNFIKLVKEKAKEV